MEVVLCDSGFCVADSVFEMDRHIQGMKAGLAIHLSTAFSGEKELTRGQVHHIPENTFVWQTGGRWARDGLYIPGSVCFGIIGERPNLGEVAEQALCRMHYFYELARAIASAGRNP